MTLDLRNYSAIEFPRCTGIVDLEPSKTVVEKNSKVEKASKEEKSEKGTLILFIYNCLLYLFILINFAISTLGTGRSRGQDRDKLDNRNRWHAVQTRLNEILHNSNSKNRVSSSLAQAVLEEVLFLPPYQNTPGEDFVETVRLMIGEVYKLLLTSREWVALVHDELHPQQHNKVNNSTLADLERLLKSGVDIKIQSPEETILKDIIKDGIEIRQECKKLLHGFDTSNANGYSSDDSKNRKNSNLFVKVFIIY
jgi:hypothetical protein